MPVPDFSISSKWSCNDWCIFVKNIVVSSAKDGVLDKVLCHILPFFKKLVEILCKQGTDMDAINSNCFDVIIAYMLYLNDPANYSIDFSWIFQRTLEISRQFDKQNDKYVQIVLERLTDLLHHSFPLINDTVTFDDQTKYYLFELVKECRLSPSFLLQLFEGIRGRKVSDRDGGIMHHILLNVLSPSFPDQQVFARVCMPLIRDQEFLDNHPETLFILVGSIVNVMRRSAPGVFGELKPHFCGEQCLRIHLYTLINSVLETNEMCENRVLYEGLRNYLRQTIIRIQNELIANRMQRINRMVGIRIEMYFPDIFNARNAAVPVQVDDSIVERVTSTFLSKCSQIKCESFECAICQETNDDCNCEKAGVVFPCLSLSKTGVRHIFCEPCLREWVKTLAKNGKKCEDVTCPCCRECIAPK